MATRTDITLKPTAGISPEQELSALAAVYLFILFDSQASKGGPHDLTNNATPKTVKNGPQKTEQEKT